MFRVLSITTLLSLYINLVAAGHIGGYNYEKPAVSTGLITAPANLNHGHSFGPIPTITPLPPVPALPPLPTPRPKAQIVQTQTLYQTHPVTTRKPLSTYLPSSGSSAGKIAKQYQSPGLQSPPPPPAPAVGLSSPSAPSTGSGASTGLGSNLPNPAPAPAQPLRVPFGKQAVISFPSGAASEATYQANGRQLKQYAVIEIIDNDIEQNTQPFLNSPFIDTFRAHIGASGTGATPEPLGGGAIQIGSRSSASVLGQQSLANDAIALGSGGLGFIRLANGNVYLGSGSLGYISSQQHSQSINEARTRTGAPQPDPLHFGHGPLGNPNQVNRYFYKF
ncbi:uncharacterized protein ACRADG_005495 [Cochliomyia hominivorax]